MLSQRPSLASSRSVVSTTSSDGEAAEDMVVDGLRASPPPLSPSKTTVTVGKIVVKEKLQGPAVLVGTANTNHINSNINVFINSKADDVDTTAHSQELSQQVVDAVKINAETFRSFVPSDVTGSATKLTGTKEDVESLSRRWCYLIAAVVTLSLITLLGTAVLSLTSWRSSQGSTGTLVMDPADKATVDGLSSEEKHFASISHEPAIVTRAMWRAMPPREPINSNKLPATLVVVCHTASGGCHTRPECEESVRAVQRFHRDARGWADVGYSFLIGGDGSVYWGRGFELMGAHTKNFNYGSVGVAFIGTYIDVLPSQSQIEAFNKLIQVGLKEGKIAADYSLVAQCQLMVTAAPGLALVRNMASWPHYNSSLPLRCTQG